MKRWAWIVIGILSTVMSGSGQQPAKDQKNSLKVDVNLVLINATVTDSQNRYVTDLEREHFQIWEDKIEQTIEQFSSEDSAMSVAIVLDVSGSMQETASIARDAAVTFLKIGNIEDEYSLVEFSNQASVAVDFTPDISKLQNRLIFAGAKGMTALYDAVYLGIVKAKQGSRPKKAVLLITDGMDNRSRYTFKNVKDLVRESDVQIYAIALTSSWHSDLAEGARGRLLLEEIVESSGGRVFFTESANELEDIATKIAVELKNQYVLGYVSTNENRDGKWRKIRVKVNPPKGLPHLTVRSKSGYHAAVD